MSKLESCDESYAPAPAPVKRSNGVSCRPPTVPSAAPSATEQPQRKDCSCLACHHAASTAGHSAPASIVTQPWAPEAHCALRWPCFGRSFEVTCVCSPEGVSKDALLRLSCFPLRGIYIVALFPFLPHLHLHHLILILFPSPLTSSVAFLLSTCSSSVDRAGFFGLHSPILHLLLLRPSFTSPQ